MITHSNNSESISHHIYKLIVPEDILRTFMIGEIIENEEELLLVLIENNDRLPQELTDKEVVLNGYMNSTTLQHFPLTGKKCYLNLHRRRWKEKGSDGSKSYHNEYQFTATGTMATKSFGDFLKRYSLTSIPSALAQQVSLPE